MYKNRIEDAVIAKIEKPQRINVSARVVERAKEIVEVIAQTEDPVKKTELWDMIQKMVPPRVFITLRMKAFGTAK